MQFKEGTDVHTIDGDKVGTIDRLVIDPITNEVTHVIVQKGFIFTEDRVIPINALIESEDDSARLSATVEDLEDFPKYEQDYFVATQPGYMDTPYTDWDVQPLYYYPPIGPEQYPYYDGPHRQKVSKQTVPESSVEIGEGTKVVTLDDEHAGDVEKVFTNEDGQLTHLLISKGIIFSTERLVPAGWVRQVNDDEIKLYVRKEVVEDLPEYTE